MAVKKLFWDNPYLTSCNAAVTSAYGNKITLDQTIAYAFAGGQQSDLGKINEYEILNAEKLGNEIFYTLSDKHSLCIGDSVKVTIDWDKRYRIMRLHFAAELVLELVYQHFNHPEKIGANITFEKARVDFYWKGNITETFAYLYRELERLISEDLNITSTFYDVENERRYWEIDGFSKVECGGTHIRKTGEIGKVRLKRNNPGGGKERIEIYLEE